MAIDLEKLKAAALEALDDMDDYARMEVGIEPIGALNHLTNFINTVCERLETAEKDAARYRWLRQQESWIPNRSELPAPFCGAVKWIGSAYSENEIDDLIDYAIASVKDNHEN